MDEEYSFVSPNSDVDYKWVDNLQHREMTLVPPLKYADLVANWNEREFKLNGRVVVKASMFPPEFKELIVEVSLHVYQ